jgi:hypothetical protein
MKKFKDLLLDTGRVECGMRAITQTSGYRKKFHPLFEKNYESGSSDGILFTHFKLYGQEGFVTKGEFDMQSHHVIVNNVQKESNIDLSKKINIKHTAYELEIINKIAIVVKYTKNFNLFVQGEKSELYDKRLVDLNANEARELGFSDIKFREICDNKKYFSFSSQSEMDHLNNMLNNSLNDNLEEDIYAKESLRLDCKNLPKNLDHGSLNGVEVLEKISINKAI